MQAIKYSEFFTGDTREDKQIPQLFALYLASVGGHEGALIALLSRVGDSVNSYQQFTLSNADFKCENGRRTTFSLNDVDNKVTRLPILLGLRPLHVACENGHERVAKLLLDYGANVCVQDVGGDMRTPLHSVASRGHEACARILLYNTEDSNLVNMNTVLLRSINNKTESKYVGGSTALTEAAAKGFTKVAQL